MNKLILRPFCKWAGGKRSLVNVLEKYVPPDFKSSNTYYEPFVGAGALLFYLQPKNAVISDVNEELINTYRVIRDNLSDLLTMLSIHEKQHSKSYFNFVRALDRVEGYLSNHSDTYRASRFIYLNKTCFNGLYRVNKKGCFNVPFGNYKTTPLICDKENLTAISKYLNDSNVKILNTPYHETLEYALRIFKKGDFVYLDPPYHPISETSNFTAYTIGDFVEKDHLILASITSILTKRGIAVLQSNSDTAFIHDVYKSYDIQYTEAKRSINCVASKRSKVKELLISNQYLLNDC